MNKLSFCSDFRARDGLTDSLWGRLGSSELQWLATYGSFFPWHIVAAGFRTQRPSNNTAATAAGKDD
ncbi:uncharacterized protein CDV56_107225 [Aspergillus thermomutatus]|uniref:Uncharacterized protein n=1 Tax=Aspergillus thermomutatus TaxID=41047 RepID=A0A397H6M9_ASPTH|nr:uncharacterized protein CDV56_107225 [Aspergillus thermomutatus]RHZ58735.1 hypothetical protein CDV56_107225 [Aspergillus thermomutatus]